MAGRTETEVKLRMADAAEARAALDRLGARIVRERHFEDNVLYDDARRRLAAAGCVLRLRTAGEQAVVTYKGPRRVEAGVKSREEIEATVGDAAAFAAILQGLGFRPLFRYQKYREVRAFEDAEIVIDETPIGVFLEIEGPVGTIHAAARALGRGEGDFISDSYVALFVAAGGRGDMVFE